MEYIIALTLWMFVGNIWVDLLNNIIVKMTKTSIKPLERIQTSLIWPYSIYTFMKEWEEGMEVYEEENDPNTQNMISRMVNSIDKYISSKLGVDIELYKSIIDSECTDEEVNDIVTVVLDEEGGEESEELKRVKELFNSKLKK